MTFPVAPALGSASTLGHTAALFDKSAMGGSAMARNVFLLALALVLGVVAVVTFMNAHPKPPAPKTTMTNAGLLLGPTPRTPKANFEDIAPPRVPDYANEKSWAALP